MLKPDRKYNGQASKIMFEESYMRTDSRDTFNDASTGIDFDFPIQFASNKSGKKMIGLRNLSVIPTIHNIKLLVQMFSAPMTEVGDECDIEWTVTEENNLEEILHLFTQIDSGAEGYAFGYSFNPTTGQVQLYGYEASDPKTHLLISFIDPEQDDTKTKIEDIYPNLTSFLKFLNQEVSDENINKLGEDSIKVFTGCWNRETLFVHSSFASSHRRLIGRNNDFWQTPSKKYEYATQSPSFNIYFTTNGHNRIFPHHCNFYFEFSFILNYDRSIE